MKIYKKIGIGLIYVFIFFSFCILLGTIKSYAAPGPIIPDKNNQLLQYIQKGDYHFWIDPGYPAIINAQIPKDDDTSKNHYVFQRSSTQGGKWVYTTTGTTNPNLFCSSTSITTGDISKSIGSISNAIANFKYVVPNTLTKCNPPLASGSVPSLNIDITSSSSGVPGSGKKSAACTDGADCVNGICQVDGGICTNTPVDGASPSCESSSFTSLEWLFCPVLRAFDGIIGTLTGIIENLLDFNVATYLNPQVKDTWNIMKNISSALLVIIMLLAIISQAVGGGPFDAYTLRKMLPRLVAAVIIIQLSWVLLYWSIQVADDIGHGVRDLISAPFGGWGNLDLKHLVAPLGGTGSFTVGTLITGLGIAFAFSGLTIFGVGMMGLSAVLTDMLAFVLLVLRQVFIVMAVILFPIAMIMWILPGTQRYWKLWSDNFIKLLLLFPLIMALIYGGRVFAHIFITATVGGNASDTDKVIATLVMFIGFFGPYWFLPKAFKWGGQLYAAAANGALNATQSIRDFPRKYALKTAGENREQRRLLRAERLAEGEGRRTDSLLAGRFNFARGRIARNRRYRETLEKGRKAGEEEALRDIIGSEYERQDHQAKLSTLRNVAQGHLDAATGIDGHNQAAQRWALDQLATFGDWDIISNMRENGQLDERTWQMFVAKNIGTIHQQAPHLSPQRTDLSQIGTQDFTTMKPFGFEEWERQFNTGTDRNATTTRVQPSADPEAKRLRMVQQARRALDDERVMANISEPDRARLQRVANADIRGQSIQVTRNARGQVNRVFLPDAHSMTDPATAPAAFASIDQMMQSEEPGVAANIRQQIGTELGGGNLTAPEQDALEAHMLDIKGQAATSLHAREIYNQVITAAHNELAARVQRAEQQAVAQGLPPAQVDAARTAAQAQVDALRQRLIANGMVPY